ncbi:hypothetical protein V2G26_015665 [Clonostachys chloroleuca]
MVAHQTSLIDWQWKPYRRINQDARLKRPSVCANPVQAKPRKQTCHSGGIICALVHPNDVHIITMGAIAALTITYTRIIAIYTPDKETTFFGLHTPLHHHSASPTNEQA